MKVRITDIGPRGLKVNDNIPLEPLNARMNLSRNNDIVFTTSPAADLLVHQTPFGAQVKGSVKASYKQPCSLCILELDRDTEVEIDYVFQRRNPVPINKSSKSKHDDIEEEDLEDDVGICYFQGEHIELEELLQESLILSIDQYYRPKEDEKGDCSVCGKKCAKALTVF